MKTGFFSIFNSTAILLLAPGPADYKNVEMKNTKFQVSKPFKSKVTTCAVSKQIMET